MVRFPRNPAAWFLALLIWFVVLWGLSSVPGGPGTAPFPHHDKVLHYTYFFIGGFLVSGGLFRLRVASRLSGRWIVVAAVLAMAFTGALDEWHQCSTPGRSGADPWDWLADVLGGASGALALMSVRRRLR